MIPVWSIFVGLGFFPWACIKMDIPYSPWKMKTSGDRHKLFDDDHHLSSYSMGYMEYPFWCKPKGRNLTPQKYSTHVSWVSSQSYMHNFLPYHEITWSHLVYHLVLCVAQSWIHSFHFVKRGWPQQSPCLGTRGFVREEGAGGLLD